MRWNKQYLDILANKCNFEDEERYMEFLEALNAVANRYSTSLPVNSILQIKDLKIAAVEQVSIGYFYKWKTDELSAKHDAKLRIRNMIPRPSIWKSMK